jgi:hypothetical protein
MVYGTTTITIGGILYAVNYEATRSQNFGESEDGTVRVYDRSAKIQFYRFVIKEPHSKISALRTFIEDTVKLRLNTISFTPDAGQNAGAGDGTAITARIWQSNLSEEQYVYHRYKYSIILRREVS